LLLFLNDVPRYSAGRSSDDIVARYVTDVTSKEWIDAGAAFYVYGSNAMGPMRAGNLPAFAQRSAAEAFAQQRGGTVHVLGAIDAPMLQTMSTLHQH
ncbi:MAG: nitrous oxide reductase accessory protein NosL, partial [Giesbergeria sp.]|nr:nitrous oxide reductase accessory protein NosL [Giesbergeria sp.]